MSSLQGRIRGCLLGGAVGDALGAPVEFLRREEIKRLFGPAGITEYAPAYGRIGALTDDTQMTLFTAEGLLRAHVRHHLKGTCSVPSVVCHSYLRWLLTQDIPVNPALTIGRDGWLWEVKDLHARRAPGKTCVSALERLSHFTAERASNSSKGAGTIMRVAPVALMFHTDHPRAATDVFALAKEISWVTHGHPTGYLAAAAFAVIVYELLHDRPLTEAIERAQRLLEEEPDHAETVTMIGRALSLVRKALPADEAIATIGQGWIAEEALGIAIYCASVAPDFAAGVRMAVNHDGDSDTTGSLVGQLLGLLHGEDGIPEAWLRDLELRETIATVADDLAAFPTWDVWSETVWTRYPGY